MAAQKQDDQHERTFSSYVRIRDVVLKTYLGRWTIGRSGERGSGISVLPARYDDDDDDICRSPVVECSWHVELRVKGNRLEHLEGKIIYGSGCSIMRRWSHPFPVWWPAAKPEVAMPACIYAGPLIGNFCLLAGCFLDFFLQAFKIVVDLKIHYVIAIHLMRWLTKFYDFRFKSTPTAAIGIHPTKAWLSQLGNFKNAIWAWGHFRRTICNKILF